MIQFGLYRHIDMVVMTIVVDLSKTFNITYVTCIYKLVHFFQVRTF